MITWEKLISGDYDLDKDLLQEILDRLEEGQKVRIGRKVLSPKKDTKAVQKLIDSEL